MFTNLPEGDGRDPAGSGRVRIVVFEALSAGVWPYASRALRDEGAVLRAAMVRHLSTAPDVDVTTVERAPGGLRGAEAALARQLPGADAAVVIAPESEGLLARFTQLADRLHVQVLGSTARIAALCGDKLATAAVLKRAGVPVVPAQTLAHWHRCGEPAGAAGWVLKPRDGVGGDGARRVFRRRALQVLPRSEQWIVQPWLSGRPRSLTAVAGPAGVRVLSVNAQRVVPQGRGLHTKELYVAAHPVTPAVRRCAKQVHAALPGLCGVFGVDYITTRDGAYVLEVNPRMTRSMAGLAPGTGVDLPACLRAVGCWPAASERSTREGT